MYLDDRQTESSYAHDGAPPPRVSTQKFDESQHPRVPAGSSGGGRFTSGQSAAVSEHVAELLTGWTEMNYDWREVQHAARAVVSGTSKDEYRDSWVPAVREEMTTVYDAAQTLLHAVNANVVGKPLYRGLQNVKAEDFEVGKTFSESLTSWTGRKDLADKFVGGAFGDRHGGGTDPVELQMDGSDMHGLHVSSHTQNPFLSAADEWLTSGRYEVVSHETQMGWAQGVHAQVTIIKVKRIGNAAPADLKKSAKFRHDQPRVPAGGPAGGEFAADHAERAARAIASHKPATAEKQRWAHTNQQLVTQYTHGSETVHNAPLDVIVKGGHRQHGIEVKTILDGSNKITMHPESRQLKERWASARHAALHTVVMDDRNRFGSPGYSGHRLYYRPGVGSFRIENMTPVRDAAHLRQLMRLGKAAFDVVLNALGQTLWLGDGVDFATLKFEEAQPRDPKGSPTGGQWTASKESMLAADLVPQDDDFDIVSDDDAEKTWGDLDDDAQNGAFERWVEDNSELGSEEAYASVHDEIIDEFSRDNEKIGGVARERVASELEFETDAPLLGEKLHSKLDAETITFEDDGGPQDAPALDLAAIRTVGGNPLTHEQQQQVVASWGKHYEKAFTEAVDKEMDRNGMDKVWELQNETQLHEWQSLPDRERMQYVREDKRAYSGPAEEVFRAATEVLGVNAEGLARSMARVAGKFSGGGTTTVSFTDDEFHVSTSSFIHGSRVRFDRTFSKSGDGIEVHHDYFTLPKGAQGGGLATSALADSLEVYDRYNVKRISLQANIDVGGYAWGKLGFQQRGHSFESAMQRRGDVSTREMELIRGAGEDAPFWFATHGGKERMLNSSWDATMYLRGSVGEAFKERLREKAKKKKTP